MPRDAVIAFFDDNEDWLGKILEQGRSDGSLRFDGPAREVARSIVDGLEGAMLVAPSYRDAQRFQDVASRLLASLAGTAPQPAQAPSSTAVDRARR